MLGLEGLAVFEGRFPAKAGNKDLREICNFLDTSPLITLIPQISLVLEIW